MKKCMLMLVLAMLFLLSGCMTEDVQPTIPSEQIMMEYEYTEGVNQAYEHGSFSMLFPMGKVEEIGINGNVYQFAPSVSMKDRAEFIDWQEKLLELLPQTSGLTFAVLENYPCRSSSADMQAFYGLDSAGTWQQILTTIQLLEGDYTNYGYVYAKANNLASKLGWQQDVLNQETVLPLDKPELLNLVYPCFLEKYAVPEEIGAAKLLAVKLYGEMLEEGRSLGL